VTFLPSKQIAKIAHSRTNTRVLFLLQNPLLYIRKEKLAKTKTSSERKSVKCGRAKYIEYIHYTSVLCNIQHTTYEYFVCFNSDERVFFSVDENAPTQENTHLRRCKIRFCFFVSIHSHGTYIEFFMLCKILYGTRSYNSIPSPF